MSGQWVCAKGASLLVPSGPDSKKHLFVIAMDPSKLEGYGNHPMVLMVGASSRKEGVAHDGACELKAGDHPFITHDSFIDYRFARIESASDVERKVQAGTFIVKQACSPELLARIVRGALSSRRINREFRQILKAGDSPS